MAKSKITNLNTEIREDIREAVSLAVSYWPNAHLGTQSPRSDIRYAFQMLRSWTEAHNIQCAVGQVSGDAYRHASM